MHKYEITVVPLWGEKQIDWQIYGFWRRWWQRLVEKPSDEGELPLTATNRKDKVTVDEYIEGAKKNTAGEVANRSSILLGTQKQNETGQIMKGDTVLISC